MLKIKLRTQKKQKGNKLPGVIGEAVRCYTASHAKRFESTECWRLNSTPEGPAATKRSWMLIPFQAFSSMEEKRGGNIYNPNWPDEFQIQHMTACTPDWEHTNKCSPQCPDFTARCAVLHKYTFLLLQADREERIFICMCWAFSYQHHSNCMWIFQSFYICSHHQWHRTTDGLSNVLFNIYQMRSAVTNCILLKCHTPTCLLQEDLLYKHCPDTTLQAFHTTTVWCYELSCQWLWYTALGATVLNKSSNTHLASSRIPSGL